MSDFPIIPYEPVYREAFAALNRAWVERHFTVEPHDIEMLYEPEKYILNDGGVILLAVTAAGEVVGTVALIACVDGSFEMAKMTVAEEFRGHGLGRQLGEAAIAVAQQRGASKIWLESNRSLAPALTLYRNLGFVEVPLLPSPYARADIRMERTL
jgi:ribosomal protein S18 acetylase RimI-like enzyme